MTVDIKGLTSLILRDLEMPALRARCRAVGMDGYSGPHPWFYTVPHEVAPGTDHATSVELNNSGAITWRRLELAADGIRIRVEPAHERDDKYVAAVIEYNERGKRVLASSGLSLSTSLRIFRQSSFWILATILLSLLLLSIVERFWKNGWQGLLGILIIFGLALSIQGFKLWRRKPV